MYDLGPNEFLFEDGDSPLQVERKPQLAVPNCVPIEHKDNQNNYNTAITTWQSQLAIFQQGLIKADTSTYHEIPRHSVAQAVASMIVQRNVNLRNTYKFKLPLSFALLEPMDVVTLTEPDMQMYKVPARMTKISENEDWQLECEAEDFNWGVNSPSPAAVAANSNTPNQTNTPPGNVGSVAIINVPAQLKQTAGAVELAIAACSSNPAWGGAAVYVSNDNVTYKLAGTIQSGCTMGTWVTGLNNIADPDPGNYEVDLTESNGQLQSATSAQQNAFESLFYAQDISSGVFEIAGYGTVAFHRQRHLGIVRPTAPRCVRRRAERLQCWHAVRAVRFHDAARASESFVGGPDSVLQVLQLQFLRPGTAGAVRRFAGDVLAHRYRHPAAVLHSELPICQPTGRRWNRHV